MKASRSVLYDTNRKTGQVVFGGDCEDILGYSANALNGDISRWVAIIHPDDQSAFFNEVGCTTSTALRFTQITDGPQRCLSVEDHIGKTVAEILPAPIVGRNGSYVSTDNRYWPTGKRAGDVRQGGAAIVRKTPWPKVSSPP